MINQEIIKKVYENPRTGFKSSLNTYKTIKELFPKSKITKKEVDEYIKNNSTAQIHSQQKINPDDYNQIVAKAKGCINIDLIDMSSYKLYNENYRFILLVIDIKSRYSFLEKLKQKRQRKYITPF